MEKQYDRMKLCNWIKKTRIQMGFRQEDMARSLKCKRSSYTNMENGKERYSPLTHLDEILTIFGPYAEKDPPYRFADYTNHKLLLYMCVFGVRHATVASVFNINSKTLHTWLWSDKTKYLLQYKNEIDDMFPEMEKLRAVIDVEIVGRERICLKCRDGSRIFIKVVPEHIKRAYESIICLLKGETNEI